MTVRAALFDMDGLLLDTERVCFDCMREVAAELELPELHDVYLDMVGHRFDALRRIFDARMAGRPRGDAAFALWNARVESRLAREGAPVKPGARELLERLKAQGAPRAVATSTETAPARALLALTGLLPLVDLVIGGDQVTRAKPDPEIYLKAAAALGVDPGDCAIFEDSDPGATAAVRAGGRVVQVPDMKAPAGEVRALGHLIAPDLETGARMLGLWEG